MNGTALDQDSLTPSLPLPCLSLAVSHPLAARSRRARRRRRRPGVRGVRRCAGATPLLLRRFSSVSILLFPQSGNVLINDLSFSQPVRKHEKSARITSDCGATRCPQHNGRNHLGFAALGRGDRAPAGLAGLAPPRPGRPRWRRPLRGPLPACSARKKATPAHARHSTRP